MQITEDTRQAVATIAQRHGFSTDAGLAMLQALTRGGGFQAQFNHPEFGGMGQSSGGMLMIGDMFNSGLKSRVEGLILDLSGMVDLSAPQWQSGDWPSDLGVPSSTGSQNGVDYAVFPQTRRLAIRQGGELSVYDTGDHQIGGVSQQQGNSRVLDFSSQFGPVSLDSLTRIDAAPAEPARDEWTPDVAPPAQPLPEPSAQPFSQPDLQTAQHSAPQSGQGDAVMAMIERLHGLLSSGALTQAEFDAKKTELLGRL